MMLAPSYMVAESVEEAVAGLQRSDGSAIILAGGIVVGSLINQGLASPELLVDISRIESLRTINAQPDGGLSIGALVTHSQILRSPEVSRTAPLLQEIARDIACSRLRNRGTLGGSLCMIGQQGDPATGLLALDAQLSLQGPAGVRKLALADFYKDAFVLDLQPSEILEKVYVPPAPTKACWAFSKIGPRNAMDFTLIAASVVVQLEDAGERIGHIRIGMNGVAPTALRLRQAERAFSKAPALDVDWRAVDEALNDEINPPGDLIYSEGYKRHLAGVVLQRAFRRAIERGTFDVSG